jgi:hypothetical protein
VQVLVFMGEDYYPNARLGDLRLTLPAVPSAAELEELVKKVMVEGEMRYEERFDLEVSWVTLLVIDGDSPVQQIDWAVDNADSAEKLEARGFKQVWAGTIPVQRAGFWGLARWEDIPRI